MALIPFAEKKLIRPGSTDPRIRARIGILHVDANNVPDLHDYFDGPSGGIESHGHIRLDGHLFQYRDTAYQADANLDANDFALAFETQGYGDGEWTAEQLATIKRVIRWAHDVHGIPLRVATSWNDPAGGWGFHTMWGAPSHWTPVAKSCPGAARIRQFWTVIAPWLRAGAPLEEDSIMATPADKAAIRGIVRSELHAQLDPLKTVQRSFRQSVRKSLRELLDQPGVDAKVKARAEVRLVELDAEEKAADDAERDAQARLDAADRAESDRAGRPERVDA